MAEKYYINRTELEKLFEHDQRLRLLTNSYHDPYRAEKTLSDFMVEYGFYAHIEAADVDESKKCHFCGRVVSKVTKVDGFEMFTDACNSCLKEFNKTKPTIGSINWDYAKKHRDEYVMIFDSPKVFTATLSYYEPDKCFQVEIRVEGNLKTLIQIPYAGDKSYSYINRNYITKRSLLTYVRKNWNIISELVP